MKHIYIIANWKSNKLINDVQQWFSEIDQIPLHIKTDEKTVIIAPSFVHIPLVHQILDEGMFPFALSSQDVSPFSQGAHTGEVNVEQIKDLATYCIVGHSERRKELGETDEVIAKKAQQAIDAKLTPILCVQDIKTPIPENITIVAYEPVFAIGTGQPDTPENAQNVAKDLKEDHPEIKVLYGGSVTPENVAAFTAQNDIDGVLVGGASLIASSFAQIIQNA